MENLAQVFNCFICMEQLKEAHLCPHCSKPCCLGCFRKWLTESRSKCPHCRATLRMKNLVNCRWIKDVTMQLNKLQQSGDNSNKEFCEIHNEELSVFCTNCEQCICHQCALWDKTHHNHIVKSLEEIYSQNMVKIDNEKDVLLERRFKLDCFIQNIEKNMQEINGAKNERVDEIMHSTSLIVSRLEDQLKKKVSTFVAQKNLWFKECKEIDLFLKSVEHLKKSCSKSELLLTSEKIIESFTEFKFKPLKYLENSLVTTDTYFPSEIIPEYEGGVFVISDFSIHQVNGEPIYSPPLKVSGLTWRLKVYPAGNGLEKGKYLSILFQLNSGFPETSKYQYRVKMAHKDSADSSDSVVREYTSEFDVGECWGFNRFYRLDDLSSEGYLNMDTDTLVLYFEVRSPTYYQKSRDQAWYINQLQAMHDQSVKHLDDSNKQSKESSKNQSVYCSEISLTFDKLNLI